MQSRRNVLKKVGSGAIGMTTLTVAGAGEAAAGNTEVWYKDCEIGSTDTDWDVKLYVSENDCNDNNRHGYVKAIADVFNPSCKHETITAKFQEKRCDTSTCYWVHHFTVQASTCAWHESCNTDDESYDEAKKSETWKLDNSGDYGGFSADEYRVKIEAQTEYNTSSNTCDYSLDTKTENCKIGPHTFNC